MKNNFDSQKGLISEHETGIIAARRKIEADKQKPEQFPLRVTDEQKHDISQTHSLERIVTMLNENSQKQDKRYEADKRIVLWTLIASVIAAATGFLAVIIAVLK